LITLEQIQDMLRTGFICFCLFITACNSKKTPGKEEETGFSYKGFSEGFNMASLPFQLSDTGLLNNKDTVSMRSAELASFIPDSLTKTFGKAGRVKFIPLVKFAAKSNDYYVVKVSGVNGKGAFLITFDKKQQFVNAFPFLIPDADPTTSQSTTIDKSFSVSKIITQKKGTQTAEGKNVYAYNAETKQFSLIMTDPLNDGGQEIINPIDTFQRKHKLAGDYIKDKKNFVSVRDGRYPNQLQVFVHFENENGDCMGELKGDVLLTSTKTAIYRQGGDPCVLTFNFTPSSVSLKEDEGCGSHRGINCIFDGTFQKKKETKAKPVIKKTGKK
jgi:hypothetical protein